MQVRVRDVVAVIVVIVKVILVFGGHFITKGLKDDYEDFKKDSQGPTGRIGAPTTWRSQW